MNEPGALVNCERALELIKSTDDKVTRNLLELAFTAFVKGRFAEDRDGPRPDGDFDLSYCIGVLKTIFSDREYVLDLLDGGDPERWFDDRESVDRSPMPDLSTPAHSIPRADAATS